MIDFARKPLFIAPMADITDRAFRHMCRVFGADISVSEMISSNALVYENTKTLKMLEKSPLESPYIVQLSANNPSVLKQAVQILNDIDGIHGIDLNAGCPVNKVIKQCAGSALLEHLDLLKELLITIKTYSNKPLTSVKVRLGFASKNILDTISAVDDVVDFVCIHGRTRAQMYRADVVDYELIARAKSHSRVPVIANGDISEQNYASVLEQTRADGLMIGRGAIGKPWIFRTIKGGKSVDDKERLDAILMHFELMCELYGEYASVRARKHLHEYSRGLDGASEFRNAVNRINDTATMRQTIKDFFRNPYAQ